MENVIFFFSGTGNCLKVAKSISKELENCEIFPMAKPFNLSKQYDSIGFVYPTYFCGLPKIAAQFIENLNLDSNKNTYYYAIATYGGNAGYAVYHIYELLYKKHGIKLNYGEKLKMFSNYIVMYNMKENVEEITNKSNADLVPIIEAIKTKKNNKASSLTKILKPVNTSFIKKVNNMDKDYNVNNNCNGCGICTQVCPVKNIELINNKPQYKHHCENCVACIQFCPQKAINYKNATENRRRYTNPEITYKELSEYNNKKV